MKKTCQICNEEKSMEEFGMDNSKKDGKLIYCKICYHEKQKRYWSINREQRNLYSKEYRQAHSQDPIFKQQKSKWDKKYNETHKEEIQKRLLESRDERLQKRRHLRRIHYEENPSYFLLQASKCRAVKRNLEHNITEEDIKIPNICPILGIPIILGKGCQTDNSPSIDRIDNNQGYVKGNIIVVSWRANDLKGKASIDELEKIVNFYKKL